MPTPAPRKRFGQHFLHDSGVIERILASIGPRRDDCMVEIGPGRGALTLPLMEKLDHLHVVELDRDLVARLPELLGDSGRYTIHSADALKFDFTSLPPAGRKLRVAGNLPYNISTPLLFHLFSQDSAIADMHFMLQKEVVDRLVAEPGSKTFGRLSIMAGFHCRMERLFDVPSGAFTPPPKVESAVIRLTPIKRSPAEKTLLPALGTLVSRAFTMRRKTLRNSLSGLMSPAEMTLAGLEGSERPEVLGLDAWMRLATLYHARGN